MLPVVIYNLHILLDCFLIVLSNDTLCILVSNLKVKEFLAEGKVVL
jgi:hypothetical protein